MNELLLSSTAAVCVAIGLLLRSQRHLHPRWMDLLVPSFFVLAVNRLLLEVAQPIEQRRFLYGLRLVVFVLLAAALFKHGVGRGRPRSPVSLKATSR